MIKAAFDANGVKIAVPMVHVECETEKAAAAQAAINLIDDKRAGIA